MGFRLTVKGAETINLSEEMISSVSVDVGTSKDSIAKGSMMVVTMSITGKLTSNANFLTNINGAGDGETLKLFQWSLVPAQSADAYRDVVVDVVTSDQIFRKIELPNAFIVDYNERYSDGDGMGVFSLLLRQKADQISKVKADGGMGVG